MSIYILSLNLKCAWLQADFGKEVGANDDEVLIAKSSTTTSTTPLQWRWAQRLGAQQDGGGGQVEGVCGGCQESAKQPE